MSSLIIELSKKILTSTVGLPLESKMERATIFVIGMILLQGEQLMFEVCKCLSIIIKWMVNNW